MTERRWYGRIENLRTNQVFTFRDPAQILPFLSGAAGLEPQDSADLPDSLADDLRD